MRHGAAFHSAFDAKKGQPILLIERAVGFLPPAHTPRCSVPDIFCEVF